MAATFLVYWPALRNGFVWDDTALVLRDPLIRSWRLIPESFGHFLFLDATASDFYRPLQRLTFTADYAIFGLEAPWGWHLTSIAIHALAAVALFALARRLIGGESAARWALGIAVVWAIHPLHTSAITYVAGRADPLAAMFGFTALALGLAALDGRRLATLGAAVCFLGALLSKESGIGALLVWFLILAWRRVGWRVFGKWAALSALVLGGYFALRFTAARTPPPPSPPTSAAIRPILAARAVAEYAGLLVLPRTLRMERDISTVPQATPDATLRNARLREYQTLLGVLLVLGLAAWWRWAHRRAPDAALALSAAALAYVPISNLFSLNATVAEHWLYVPSAFLFLALAISLRETRVGMAVPSRPRVEEGAGEEHPTSNIQHPTFNGRRHPRTARRAIPTCALAVWVVFLAVRTFLRQADWKDQRTFLERTVADGGDTPRMHINLGNLEFQAGRADLAVAHYREALRRTPGQPMAWFALANVAVRTRDFATAHEALAHAEKSPLLAADILQTRAALEHLETGRDTGDLLRQAVGLAPRNWPLRKRHLEHLDETGRTAEAARELGEFLQAQPFRADSWKLLGTLLEKLRQPEAAAAAYAEAAARDARDRSSRAKVAALAKP